MSHLLIFNFVVFFYIFLTFDPVRGVGVMLLYKPKDVTEECVTSQDLRYDLSFGMGMSDTTTLVFRSLFEVSYQCRVEITTDRDNFIIIVVRYPDLLSENCVQNPDGFKLLKKEYCLSMCQLVDYPNHHSHYLVAVVKNKFRFIFTSNSTLNADLNSNAYQFTATSARKPGVSRRCMPKNETLCVVNSEQFCITSFSVCDGIKNCGVTDWYDERKAGCNLPEERLSRTAIVAVLAAMLLVIVAGGHMIVRCMPQQANSLFIFNANEDNRLNLEPVLKPQEYRPPQNLKIRKDSLIPVSSSSSSVGGGESEQEHSSLANELATLTVCPSYLDKHGEEAATPRRITTVRNVTAKIQEKLRSVATRSEKGRSTYSAEDDT